GFTGLTGGNDPSTTSASSSSTAGISASVSGSCVAFSRPTEPSVGSRASLPGGEATISSASSSGASEVEVTMGIATSAPPGSPGNVLLSAATGGTAALAGSSTNSWISSGAGSGGVAGSSAMT